MNKLRSLLAKSLAVLLVIALICGGLGFAVSREAWPQTAGRFNLPGLGAAVEVVRDQYGVPHIYADTPADLFAAQGYVHAQERFFQMEFSRRIGQGRLSELLGRVTLAQDKFIRTLGWHRAAQRDLQALSADTLAVLDAYSRGVNARVMPLATNPGRLALEYRLLALTGAPINIEPWLPVHSSGWATVMAWDLRGDALDQELLNGALLQRGGAELLRALRPDYPTDMPLITPAPVRTGELMAPESVGSDPALAIAMLQALDGIDSLLGHDQANGSNSWVISGAKSKTGMALLANDPHLGIQMPGIWFEMGLHCRVLSDQCPYDMAGVSFAGVPGIVIGHNTTIGWGLTNAEADVQDLFTERPNPADPAEFEYEGRWEKAQVIDEQIGVANEAPVTLTVRITRHGPLFNEVSNSLRNAPPTALRWSALDGNRLLDSVLALNRARDFSQFRSALELWGAPAQNVTYVDSSGNIGYQLAGRIPLRKRGIGDVTSNGWGGDQAWLGYAPFDSLPSVYNPPAGMIVSANNAITALTREPFIGNDVDFGYRARRIVELLNAQPRHGIADFQRIQLDASSGLAADLLPAIRAIIASDVTGDPASRQAWQLLASWDGQSDAASPAALIWETYWNRLLHAVFDDELGPLNQFAIGTGSASRIALRNVVAQPDSAYWDDTTTGPREDQRAIVLRAWHDSLARLSARFGADPGQWAWGRAHTASFRNATLGSSGIAVVEQIFNRGPFPVSGAGAAVNAMGHFESMEVRSIPSMRMILSPGKWDDSQIVLATGQSGHPFHPNYDDQTALWRNGQLRQQSFSQTQVNAAKTAVLVLTP